MSGEEMGRKKSTGEAAGAKTGERELKAFNYIAYGLGDLYGGGSFFIISTFSMFFLVTVVGLNPVLAGLIPGLGKVWDSISDPLMGYLTDHTKSRYGRRRIYFLIAVLPVAVTFTLIWIPFEGGGQTAKFLYYLLAYLFFYTCSTMVLVPYSALSAEMTLDFKKRNRLTGTRMIFSMAGTMVSGIFAQPLIDYFGDERTGHLVMGLVFGLFFALPYIVVFFGTWELPVARKPVSSKVSIFRNFRSILHNRSFRIHMGMYIFSYAAMDILMAWLKFYLIDYLRRPGFVSIGLGTILITQMLVLPLYVRMANRVGHGAAYRTGLMIWAGAMLLMAFQSATTPLFLLIGNCFLIGLGLSAGVMIPYQLLPFVADVDELITTEHRAGTYAGAMTLLRKLIQGAFVLPLLGILLTAIGYISHSAREAVQQSPQTLLWLRILFVGSPFVLASAGVLISLRFPITPSNHQILRAEIDRLRAGGLKEDVDETTRQVCEKLTGKAYGELYLPEQD
jgi:oligogalacturonide transporter